jgi:ubiquinone/menaquinone biosynthesis C-methylase UbiE
MIQRYENFARYSRSVDAISRDLIAYYDQEAKLRAERPIDARRVACQQRFAQLLVEEGRTNLVEVGTGPGRDAMEFMKAGLRVSGIDLSAEHVKMAQAVGAQATQASMFNLPYARRSFDAGWTMSTLVHVPDSRFEDAMNEITSALQDGAPLAIGLWGGFDEELISTVQDIQPPRFFSLRSHDRAREMLAKHTTVEHFETWDYGDAGHWEYQFAIVRIRH